MLKYAIRLIWIFLFSMLFLTQTFATGLAEGKRIAAGDKTSVFVDSSGTAWILGNAYYNNELEKLRPRFLLNDSQFVYQDMGSTSIYIVRKDGSLWGWGTSLKGQLGVKTTTENPWILEPVQILPRVRSMNPGDGTPFAIKPDGSLWVWGGPGNKRGDTSREYRVTPRKLMNHVKLVSSFGYYTLALKEDGSLWAWGRNLCGSLGDGTQKDSIKPRKVDLRNLKGRKIVTLANHLGNSYAVTSDGLLWYWGERRVYRGYCVDNLVLRPTLFKAVDNVQDIVLSWFNILILKKDGTVWWMPVENVRDNKPPKFIMQDVQEIAAGVRHYVVLKKDGTVWTWGENRYGQLGDGTTTDRNEPKQVVFPK